MKYRLYVYCRKNGLSRAPALHVEGEYKSDSDAKNDLRSKGNKLFRFYDEVYMTFVRVEEDGKEVEI